MSKECNEPQSKRLRSLIIQLYELGGGSDIAQRKVAFAPGYPVRDLKLMEVPKDLLQSVLDGDELRIVGKKGGDAVLCSEHRSYGMKRVETSNSVFFVPPSSSGVFQIETAATDYFELQPISGRLDQLRALLQDSAYAAPASISGTARPGPFYTVDQLLEKVQASRAEVLGALREMGAVEVEGCVRVVSRQAVWAAVQALLQAAVAQGWDLGAVTEDRCLAALRESGAEGADVVVLRAALRSLCLAAEGAEEPWRLPSASDAATVWGLDASKVRAAAARVLLAGRQRAGGVGAEEFLQEWSLVAPGLLQATRADLAGLRGVAVLASIDKTGGREQEEVVVLCLAEDLVPLDPKARCDALFRIKSAFTAKELGPYFPDLTELQLRDLLLTQAGCCEAAGKVFSRL